MMLTIIYRTQFKKDYKVIKKRGKEIKKLEEVILLLVAQEKLPTQYRDHALIGNFAERRECHLESDWLLIYKIDGELLILERTGSHSDLFDK